MVTTLLDLLALGCLCAFAFFVWPPLTLLVVSLGLLAASARATE